MQNIPEKKSIEKYKENVLIKAQILCLSAKSYVTTKNEKNYTEKYCINCPCPSASDSTNQWYSKRHRLQAVSALAMTNSTYILSETKYENFKNHLQYIRNAIYQMI